MWKSSEEREIYLARVKAEEEIEQGEVMKAKRFRDLRTSVKLLNNMVVDENVEGPEPRGILFHDPSDRAYQPDYYELQYDCQEAIDFIKDVQIAYNTVVEKRNIDVDNLGITLMFEFLYRSIQPTLEEGDMIHISHDRVVLFRNDVAVLAEQENR